MIKNIINAFKNNPTYKSSLKFLRTTPWANFLFLAKKYENTTENFSKFRHDKIKEKLTKSSVVIAICMQRDLKESLPEWEELASVSMAVQNMWLMASNLGIGSYWSSPSLMNYLGEHISLLEGEKCLGFFYMGKYSAEIALRKPGAFEDKIERFY